MRLPSRDRRGEKKLPGLPIDSMTAPLRSTHVNRRVRIPSPVMKASVPVSESENRWLW
jgi:hypothetical protein